jgi:hypothetical protein
MEYRHKGSSVKEKFTTKPCAGKVMLTVFCNSEGVVLTEFLEKGATKLYTDILKYLKKHITRNGAKIDDILFQQDNARPHTSATTTDAIARLGFTVLSQPAYSP